VTDKTLNRKLLEAVKQSYEAEAQLNYSLYCFGNYLAKREKYKSHAGLDAIHFYLIRKYNWPLETR
jgi:hypothetical protein